MNQRNLALPFRGLGGRIERVSFLAAAGGRSMSTIRIETTIDSDTLYLPQLKAMVGKSVEIIVRERTTPNVSPATSDWAAVEAAVRGLEDYDFEAYREAREEDRHRANGDRS